MGTGNSDVEGSVLAADDDAGTAGSAARVVATIGYEQTALRDFIQTLREEGIACVIDVRDLPQSRRAGFSKRQLAASLEEAGIAYVHLKALGTPKEGRVANRQRDYPRFWDIVERQLARPEAELDLQRAAEIAGKQRARCSATKPTRMSAIGRASRRCCRNGSASRRAISRSDSAPGQTSETRFRLLRAVACSAQGYKLERSKLSEALSGRT